MYILISTIVLLNGRGTCSRPSSCHRPSSFGRHSSCGRPSYCDCPTSCDRPSSCDRLSACWRHSFCDRPSSCDHLSSCDRLFSCDRNSSYGRKVAVRFWALTPRFLFQSKKSNLNNNAELLEKCLTGNGLLRSKKKSHYSMLDGLAPSSWYAYTVYIYVHLSR